MNLRRDVPILLAAAAAIIGASLDGDGRWLHWVAKPLTTLLIAAIVWQALKNNATEPRSAGRRPATSHPVTAPPTAKPSCSAWASPASATSR